MMFCGTKKLAYADFIWLSGRLVVQICDSKSIDEFLADVNWACSSANLLYLLYLLSCICLNRVKCLKYPSVLIVVSNFALEG